jgi:hypothetical protein
LSIDAVVAKLDPYVDVRVSEGIGLWVTFGLSRLLELLRPWGPMMLLVEFLEAKPSLYGISGLLWLIQLESEHGTASGLSAIVGSVNVWKLLLEMLRGMAISRP